MSEYLISLTQRQSWVITRVGQFIDTWTKLTILQRHNGVDTGELVMPWDGEVAELCAGQATRVEVFRDAGSGWEYFTGGPVECDDSVEWSADAGSDTSDPGQMALYWASDDAYLTWRITYPNPAADFEHQTATARYTRTGVNAETVMRDLVRLNGITGSALSARVVPNLTLGTVAGVGTNVNYSTRFEPLTDALRAVASVSGLGFRVVRDGPDLEFRVFQPVDRSGEVRYSRAVGNLRKLSYRHQQPAASVALVGGDGTGTSRATKEVPNAGWVTQYGRRELFVSASSSDATELLQQGSDALTQNGEQVTLGVVALDTVSQQLGRQYNVGDRVSVEVRPGLVITDVVTSALLEVTPSGGETVAPVIGTGQATGDSRSIALVRRIGQRLGQIERA
jgi:hypothetical protein